MTAVAAGAVHGGGNLVIAIYHDGNLDENSHHATAADGTYQLGLDTSTTGYTVCFDTS